MPHLPINGATDWRCEIALVLEARIDLQRVECEEGEQKTGKTKVDRRFMQVSSIQSMYRGMQEKITDAMGNSTRKSARRWTLPLINMAETLYAAAASLSWPMDSFRTSHSGPAQSFFSPRTQVALREPFTKNRSATSFTSLAVTSRTCSLHRWSIS